jgi:hypothetical protein
LPALTLRDGSQPANAATFFECAKRLGDTTSASHARAVTRPTPGTVIKLASITEPGRLAVSVSQRFFAT